MSTAAKTSEDDSGLDGKVAIIAGGGAAGDGIGNGRAAAILLARAGTKVLVVDRDHALAERTVAMIAEEGGTAAAHQADLTDNAQARHMVDGRARPLRSPRFPRQQRRHRQPRHGGGGGPRRPGAASCRSTSSRCSSPPSMRSPP